MTSGMFAPPFLTIPQMVEAHAQHTPKAPALLCGEEERSWGAFYENACRIASHLMARGLQKGDAVAVLSDNSIAYFEILIGILKAGGVAVPLSPLLSAGDAGALMRDADVKAVFYARSGAHMLEGFDTAPLLSCIKIDDAAYAEILKTPLAETYPPLDPDDRASIIYSSGTTGTPKGIVHVHMARTHYAMGFAQAFRLHRAATCLLTTGAYSNGSWLIIAPFLYTGCRLIILPKLSLDAFFPLMEKERISHTFLVPTQVGDILADTRASEADFTCLEGVVVAGSLFRPELKRRAWEELTPNLFELYGCTEGMITLQEPHDLPAHMESVGRAITGADIRIVGENNEEAPIGEPGEICGWSQYLSSGYLNRPDLTEELLWRVIDGRAYARSGDIGVMDADGFVRIVGRKKEMIVSGGFNVFPVDIESVLTQHPGVRDVCVAGRPDERWGEVPFGFIIVEDGSTAAPDEVMAWVNKRVSKHQRLRGLKIVDSFPRNALGKVVKRELDFS